MMLGDILGAKSSCVDGLLWERDERVLWELTERCLVWENSCFVAD